MDTIISTKLFPGTLQYPDCVKWSLSGIFAVVTCDTILLIQPYSLYRNGCIVKPKWIQFQSIKSTADYSIQYPNQDMLEDLQSTVLFRSVCWSPLHVSATGADILAVLLNNGTLLLVEVSTSTCSEAVVVGGKVMYFGASQIANINEVYSALNSQQDPPVSRMIIRYMSWFSSLCTLPSVIEGRCALLVTTTSDMIAIWSIQSGVKLLCTASIGSLLSTEFTTSYICSVAWNDANTSLGREGTLRTPSGLVVGLSDGTILDLSLSLSDSVCLNLVWRWVTQSKSSPVERVLSRALDPDTSLLAVQSDCRCYVHKHSTASDSTTTNSSSSDVTIESIECVCHYDCVSGISFVPPCPSSFDYDCSNSSSVAMLTASFDGNVKAWKCEPVENSSLMRVTSTGTVISNSLFYAGLCVDPFGLVFGTIHDTTIKSKSMYGNHKVHALTCGLCPPTRPSHLVDVGTIQRVLLFISRERYLQFVSLSSLHLYLLLCMDELSQTGQIKRQSTEMCEVDEDYDDSGTNEATIDIVQSTEEFEIERLTLLMQTFHTAAIAVSAGLDSSFSALTDHDSFLKIPADEDGRRSKFRLWQCVAGTILAVHRSTGVEIQEPFLSLLWTLQLCMKASWAENLIHSARFHFQVEVFESRASDRESEYTSDIMSAWARGLPVPSLRELRTIYFASQFLYHICELSAKKNDPENASTTDSRRIYSEVDACRVGTTALRTKKYAEKYLMLYYSNEKNGFGTECAGCGSAIGVPESCPARVACTVCTLETEICTYTFSPIDLSESTVNPRACPSCSCVSQYSPEVYSNEFLWLACLDANFDMCFFCALLLEII